MGKLSYLFALCFSVGTIVSQEIFPSNTFLKTCYQKETCFANQSSSNFFYDEISREIYLVIDFIKFRTGVDSLDAWLDDLDDTKFIFKGVLNVERLPALSNHGYKTIVVNGSSKFNNVDHAQTLEIVFFKIATEGLLYHNSGNDNYDKIRVNIHINIKPKDFNLDKKPHHLKKSISVNISSGFINPLKPGMENLIAE